MLDFPHPLPKFPMSAQASFLSIAHNKKLRCEKFLSEMDRVMPWGRFIGRVLPYYTEKEVGRKHKELKMMLKIYFAQKWYDLSDPAMEDAIYDRNSFQKFLGIDLLGDAVPDETTICKFRHLLENHDLQEEFFTIVNDLLEEKGLILKQGTITDATIINAPSSTKNKERKRDPAMSSTKKGNQWYFGMKVHVGTDLHGIVHHLATTVAKVHDSVVTACLYHGEEKAKFGDKAYSSQKEKKKARKAGIFYGIADKKTKNHALSSSQRKRNRQTSSVRSFVEHPFQVIKCQWNFRKVRYRGMHKNTMHFFALFAACNLYRVRRQLLVPVPS
jgi:transposase, IS5 family